MSFWSANDKIPVQQTKVAIPAEHGLDYTSGQKINIIVPPTIKYFQPKASYLRFDVELLQKLDHPVKLTLDEPTGAQCLIRDIRIYSGGSGAVLLEEIQNYNVLTALKYDYETNDAIKNKRGLHEGSLAYNPTQRGTRGSTKTGGSNTRHNPYHTPYETPSAGTKEVTQASDGVWGADGNTNKAGQYQSAKVLLPLNTGIFQSPKVFPSLLTEGLRIEILLEDAERVYRLPDSMHPHRRLNAGLRFHSMTGVDADVSTNTGKFRTADKTGAGALSVLYFQRENQNISLENLPFCIGQKVAFYADPGNSWSARYNNPAQIKRVTTDKEMIIQDITLMGTGLIQIRFTEGEIAPKVNVDSTFYLCDDSIIDSATGADENAGVGKSTTINLDYKIKNTELILQTLTMPQGYTQKLMSMMSAGGAMNYDLLSFTNYKYSQLKGDRVMNMRLPLNQTKAKSILCIPTDAGVYTTRQLLTGVPDADPTKYKQQDAVYPAFDMDDTLLYQETIDACDRGLIANRTGLVGIADEASDYQFFYNGQLNPNRPVDLTKISRRIGVQQQPLIENEKALAMAGITPLSFMKFRENFFIGRALALQQGVYNTSGRDFNLQVNYQGTRTPVKNKLWNNFVAHIRRIVVQGDSVVVQI